MKNDFAIADILEEYSVRNPEQLIHLDESNRGFTSPNFASKDAFTRSLFELKPSDSPFSPSDQLVESSKYQVGVKLVGDDALIFKRWKNVANISARLVEHNDQVIVLECLVDKENRIYEEREFRSSLFAGYELKLGSLFYLRFFDRENETRMEIHNDPNFTFLNDFPKKDFTSLFKESKLFKGKN